MLITKAAGGSLHGLGHRQGPIRSGVSETLPSGSVDKSGIKSVQPVPSMPKPSFSCKKIIYKHTLEKMIGWLTNSAFVDNLFRSSCFVKPEEPDGLAARHKKPRPKARSLDAERSAAAG